MCGALPRAALNWHWAIGGGLEAQQIPLIIETGAAAAIAVTSRGPFGAPERATGRALALTGLATALALTGLAIGVLQLAVTGASLNGGILALARNVLGLTGIGLATSLATGGLLAWTLPLGYLAFAQYAPHRPRRPRLATRPPRRAPTNSMKADPEPAQHNYTSAASSALTCAI